MRDRHPDSAALAPGFFLFVGEMPVWEAEYLQWYMVMMIVTCGPDEGATAIAGKLEVALN